VKRPGVMYALLGMLLLLVALTLFATTQGAMSLPLNRLWYPENGQLRQIWLTVRLPRVLFALLVGAALAISGCVMQGVFRNPLADPGLLGISSGSALAVACWLVLPFPVLPFIGLYMPMLVAFIGSLSVMLVLFLLSKNSDSTMSRLLLVGLAINALSGAAVGLLSWVSNDVQLRQLSQWGMGSFGQAQWLPLTAAVTFIVPSITILLRFSRQLDLLQLGDEEAHYLGVNVPRLHRVLLLASALLVAAAVATSGIIGFIGLVVPHLIRMWLGPDHRALLPGSALAGAILLLLADTAARTMAAPAEIPVGLITSLLGAPWFLWLIFKQRRIAYG
jgi:iron complex transport system permease protein